MTLVASDVEKIREELRRILSSSQFKASNRRRQFLEFVVDRALKGETMVISDATTDERIQFKELIIGWIIFGIFCIMLSSVSVDNFSGVSQQISWQVQKLGCSFETVNTVNSMF